MKIRVNGSIVRNSDKWIYDWFGIEATCPKDINDALEKANGQDVDVEINSGGGDIFAGSEIYTALRSYKGGGKNIVVGLAASAASVIAMSRYCEMSPTAMMMVHNVSSYAEGDHNAMDKQSEVLKTADKTIAAAYMAKTGMSEEEALAMMDQETWLTAQQALEKKLVDAVMFDTLKLAAAYGSGLLPESVLEKIRNTVKNPLENEADFLLQKSQAQLNLLKLGGQE